MADESFWDLLEDHAYLGINGCTGDSSAIWDLNTETFQGEPSRVDDSVQQRPETGPMTQSSQQEDPFMGSNALDDDLFEGDIVFSDNDEFNEQFAILQEQTQHLDRTSDMQAIDLSLTDDFSHNNGTSSAQSTSAYTTATPAPTQQTSTSIDLTTDDVPVVPSEFARPRAQPNPDPEWYRRRVTFNEQAPHYLAAAMREYEAAYHREHTRHMHILACWLQAKAGPTHVTRTECMRGALAIWHHMLLQRVVRVRTSHPPVSFRDIQEYKDPRDLLRDTLKLVIVHQNPCNQSPTQAEKMCYDANIAVETLRWEADMMSDLTSYYNRQKLEMIRETGIKHKIMDGFMVDLVAMISYPVHGGHAPE